MRNGLARRRLVLVVVIPFTRVGGCGCGLGCGLYRGRGGRLHCGEELRRPIEGRRESLEDLLVDCLDIAVVVGIVAGVVGLCLLSAETLRDMHDWPVAVGVVARHDLSVGEVMDVVVGLFGVGKAAGCSHAAKNAAVCAVVVAHGCWLACEVASEALGWAER